MKMLVKKDNTTFVGIRKDKAAFSRSESCGFDPQVPCDVSCQDASFPIISLTQVKVGVIPEIFENRKCRNFLTSNF